MTAVREQEHKTKSDERRQESREHMESAREPDSENKKVLSKFFPDPGF